MTLYVVLSRSLADPLRVFVVRVSRFCVLALVVASASSPMAVQILVGGSIDLVAVGRASAPITGLPVAQPRIKSLR
jgi:hypothetical protein